MSAIGKDRQPPPPANDGQTGPNRETIALFLSQFSRPCGWIIGSNATVKMPGRSMRAEHFDSLEGAVDYAVAENEKHRNIYHIPAEFHGGNYSDPPSRDDMTGSQVLWVDIDPNKEEDIAIAKPRIFSRLTDRRPPDVPPPAIIVDSGNGYQAYWRTQHLSPQIVEAKNRWLIEMLGADRSAFNINRLMRVPGTVNYPTETKRKMGRVAQQADLIELHSTAGLAADSIPSMERPSPPPTPSVLRDDADYTRRSISDADLAEMGIAQSVRALIVSGWDPSSGIKGRSEAVFSATVSLVRQNVPEDDIYSILLDEDLRISDHVLDQQNPERYAKRQIARAKEKILSPELAEMNEKHAVIASVGGRCMVTRWLPSPLDSSRQVLQLQRIPDFKQSYLHRPAGPPDNPSSLGTWWLEQPRRRQYENLIFVPGGPEEIGDSLNLWRGFAIEASPGNWSRLRAHILENLAAGNEDHAAYIVRWAAWAVQNPDKPAEVALVLKGGRGTGKGIFGTVLMKIFGQHGLQVSTAKHVAGNFNAHLRDTCFLFSDESYFPGAKSDEGTLKRLLTETNLFIEPKGVDGEQHPNRLHVLMASNEDWVVPAGLDERRFAVFQVGAAHQQDASYFGALLKELNTGGREAFLYDLMNMDLGEWHPRDVPQTSALLEQKLATLAPQDEWFFDLLQHGSLPNPEASAPNKALARGLFLAARESFPRLRDVSDTKLGHTLRKWGCSRFIKQNKRGWVFPPLRLAREKFEKAIRSPIDWDRPGLNDWQPSDDLNQTDIPF